jgi:transposase-like protein
LLRKGATVRAVAAEFGQPVSLIERWHEEVMAERSGPLAAAGLSARTKATP